MATNNNNILNENMESRLETVPDATAKNDKRKKSSRRVFKKRVKQCLICGAIKQRGSQRLNEDDEYADEIYGDTELKDMKKKHKYKFSTSSAGTSSTSGSDAGDGDMDDTAPLEANVVEWTATGAISGLVMSVVNTGFSNLVCI